MTKLQIEAEAPNFILNDFNGTIVDLSSFRSHKNVLVVFNRSFL